MTISEARKDDNEQFQSTVHNHFFLDMMFWYENKMAWEPRQNNFECVTHLGEQRRMEKNTDSNYNICFYFDFRAIGGWRAAKRRDKKDTYRLITLPNWNRLKLNREYIRIS